MLLKLCSSLLAKKSNIMAFLTTIDNYVEITGGTKYEHNEI